MEKLPRGTPIMFKTPLDIELSRRAAPGFIMGYRTEPNGSLTVNIHERETGAQRSIPYTEELVAPLKQGRRRKTKEESDE